MADPRYLTVRRRLDQLGYKQQFEVGSLALIERLLDDVVQQNAQLKCIDRAPPCKPNTYVCSLPTSRCGHLDYAKVVKENNELQLKMMKMKEDCDIDLKALKNQLRKIENQNEDLLFLNNQYLLKIQSLEKESKLKSDKLNELQEKNLRAVIQTSGGKRNFAFKHQQLNIDAFVPSGSARPDAQLKNPFPYDKLQYADLLLVVEERVSKLKSELENERATNERSKDLIESLRKRVEVGNIEKQRLAKLIDVRSPCGWDNINNSLVHADHAVTHMSLEMEHMKRLHQDLEKQLKEALNANQEMQAKFSTLTTQNKHLAMELEDVDRVAQALKKQKEDLVNTADSEMSDAKTELQNLCAEIDRLRGELSRCKKENELLSKDKNELEALRKKELDQRQLQNTFLEDQQAIEDVEKRLKAALLREKELERQLDEQNHLIVKDIQMPELYLSKVVRSIEGQRDFYKEKVKELFRIVREIEQNGKEPQSGTDSVPPLQPLSITELLSSPLVKLLEEERNVYKSEYLKLKAASGATDSQDSSEQSMQLHHKLRQVMEERDELSKTLEMLEKHVEELNNSLQDVYKEKEMLREQCRKQQSEKRPTTDNVATYQAQKERDVARAELQGVLAEVDDLRHRLKLATGIQVSERGRLEKQILDLQADLQVTSDEKAELLSKNSSYQVLITSMQEQMDLLRKELAELRNEALQEKSNANKLRIIANQSEKSFKDAQRILSLRSSEQSEEKQKVQDLEMKIAELQHIIDGKDADLNSLRNSIRALDREKDALQMDLDQKTERLAAAQQELASKVHEVKSSKTEVGALESRLDRIMEELLEKDAKCQSLERKVDMARAEAVAVSKTRDEALQRIRQYAEDLRVMTRENQALMGDIQNLTDERDDLKRQIQEFVGEVARVEELLESKELERTTLLEQFKTLTSATSSLESQKSHLETVSNNSRMELLAKDSELTHLQDIVSELNLEIQNYLSRQQETNQQIIELHQSLSDVESRLHVSEAERERLQREVSSVRDLCVKLDSGKAQHADAVKSKDRDIERLERSNAEWKQQVEVLKVQLATIQSEVGNLEQLLAANRQKEFLTDIQNHELADDLNLVKERLRKAEVKLEEQIQTALRYRARVTDLEMEVDRLKRQLTNERFERERLYQELKRFRQSTPGMLSEYLERGQISSETRRTRASEAPSPVGWPREEDVRVREERRSMSSMEFSRTITSGDPRPTGVPLAPSVVITPPSQGAVVDARRPTEIVGQTAALDPTERVGTESRKDGSAKDASGSSWQADGD